MKVRIENAKQGFNMIRQQLGQTPYIPPGEQGRLFFEEGDLPKPVTYARKTPTARIARVTPPKEKLPWWLRD